MTRLEEKTRKANVFMYKAPPLYRIRLSWFAFWTSILNLGIKVNYSVSVLAETNQSFDETSVAGGSEAWVLGINS